ncbi:MAG: PAS domain S-box protein [Mycobacterium sp.]|nr:PAS domain S-box protein [Mycobacterium sp.]
MTASVRLGFAAAVLVIALATLDWVGWVAGIPVLTRIVSTWPEMTPWTALWLAALGAAILLQSGHPSKARIWAGRVLSLVVGAAAALVLVEYATGRGFGVDLIWFGNAVSALDTTWPGRPSPHTAVATLLLSTPVGLTQLNRRWASVVWTVSSIVAMTLPGIAVLAYVFDALDVVVVATSTGMSLLTAIGLLFLGAAALLARPDRAPIAWLISRTDQGSRVRLGLVIAGFPLLVGLSRRIFLTLGVGRDAALTFSTAVSTVAVGLLALYLGERERKQYEVAESERNQLRAIADSMLDPQTLLEAVRDSAGQVVDLRYLTVNSAAVAELGLGLGRSQLIGRTQLEVSPTLRNSDLQRRFFQCLEDGEPVVLDDFPFFSEILQAVRHYDIRATRTSADRLNLTWRDVTERSDLVRRIADSEEKYRLLAENAADVVMLIRDGKFVWSSPSVEDVLGAPPEYWLGRAELEIVPPEEESAHFARVKTLAEGGAVKGRARVRSLDGVTHWVHLFAKPFYDADGRQDGIRSAFRVIDAEVAAQQAEERARADARLRRAVESAAVGMCLIAPDGRLLEVNNALCDLFGYDAETLTQKTWQELTAPEHLEVDLKYVEDVKTGRIDSYRLLKQYIHANGHRIWGDSSVGCVRDDDAQLELFISQVVDVTATIQAEERNLILTQRLQRQSDQMAVELARAADYMKSIMPRSLTGKVAVSSRYLPAQELGGDCFYYNWMDDDHLLVYMIDVSGHGVEPALLAVSVHNMLRSGSLAQEAVPAPEAVLAGLNGLFQMDRQNDHYFTMWIGVYEASNRVLRYASAGAPPAFAFNSADGTAAAMTELSATSEPVGMFEDTVFTCATYAVPPGCQILLFSDGAYELQLDDDRQLSLDDFRTLVTRMVGSEAWSLDDLVAELRTLTREESFEDDCSLIQLKFD